jgi:heterodisulfide reductase subunit B
MTTSEKDVVHSCPNCHVWLARYHRGCKKNGRTEVLVKGMVRK